MKPEETQEYEQLKRSGRRGLLGLVVLVVLTIGILLWATGGNKHAEKPAADGLPTIEGLQAEQNTSGVSVQLSQSEPTAVAPNTSGVSVQLPQSAPAVAVVAQGLSENAVEQVDSHVAINPVSTPDENGVVWTHETIEPVIVVPEPTPADRQPEAVVSRPVAKPVSHKTSVPKHKTEKAEPKVKTLSVQDILNNKAAVGKTPSGSHGRFTVQSAAFTAESQAAVLRRRLADKGFAARIERAQTSRGLFYRVRVGSFDDRESARRLAERLQAAGFDAVVAVR